MDGWVGRFVSGWIEKCMNVSLSASSCCLDGWEDRWMMDGWVGGWMDAWVIGRVDIDGWMGG